MNVFAPDRISLTWPMVVRGECRFDGRLVHLTPAECDVLATLLLHRGCPVMPSEMIEAIYHPDREPEWSHNCVLVYVYRLRRKLPGLIHQHGPTTTHRGFQGWVIDRPQELRAAA